MRPGSRRPRCASIPAGCRATGAGWSSPGPPGAGSASSRYAGQEIADLPAKYLPAADRGARASRRLFIGSAGRARLVGVARQWIGGVPGRPFAYRGGIGPWRRIGPAPTARLSELGNRLASAFGLVGWFGVDYVLRDGHPLAGRGQPAVHGVGRDPRAGLGPAAVAGASGRLRGDRSSRRRISRITSRSDHGSPASGSSMPHSAMVIPESTWDEGVAADPGVVPAIADIPAPERPSRRGSQ